ncbi:MAG: hypothetical protein ABSA64_09330 [Sedimentisphaerales bacterium]
MSRCLAVIVLGAAEDEGTFWIQLLMVVILAASVGIYGLVKSRTKRLERETHDEIIETIIEPPKPLVKKCNLSGGMELLARNFLVGVVEQTDTADQRDIEMRRLCFAELARRGELWAVASIPLKVYTLDENGFYGKVIRCEAMAELAGRTRPGEDAAEDSETTNEPGSSRTGKSPQDAANFQNSQGLETDVPKEQKEHTM